MRKFIFMLFTAIVLSSCGGLTYVTVPNSVALNQGNFKVIKVVNAETDAHYILGIGGLSASATEDVVEKLRQKACLQKNQALADIHIKTTTKVFVLGLYIKRTLTASATVVEFQGKSIEGLEMNNQIEKIDSAHNVQADEHIISEAVNETSVKKVEYTRETACRTLMEINKDLEAGKIDNLELIKQEIDAIKKWYYSHNMVSMDIEKQLRISKKYLR